ncbi:YqcI/YcgG family protein [Saccharopolyspora shandongensis]|uniref:YqcI/YcgG family protein n=1 Tax=Saccharopolyspora shandongensis TaxID=418495 RepID=UPI0033D942F5
MTTGIQANTGKNSDVETEWAGQVYREVPSWGENSLREFHRTVRSADAPFPCTFGVSAAKRGMLRFGFVEDLADERTWGPLVGILAEYLSEYREIGRETSLVVYFRPESAERSLANYRERFWALLQYLHEHDPKPWPGEIPTDSDDPMWEFSFAGTPIFVVCNTPAHTERRSRHSGGFLVTFQPRWVFEELAVGTAKGDAARRVIRERLRRYDGMEPAGSLGAYGDPENREWLQYFLPDSDAESDAPVGCPFRAAAQQRNDLAGDR